ncbi:MerR family DNA-binding transcriptional regulator [soil metagenome]
MKIGDVSRETGLSTSRIRFYERTGLITAAERAGNGYRDYNPDIVPLLLFIEQAQALGFTLREISGAGPTTGDHIVRCDHVISLLKTKLESVDALILAAKERRARIAALIADFEGPG